MKKHIPILVVFVFVLCFILIPNQSTHGFRIGCSWTSYLTYHFFHVNVFHLITNCMACYFVLKYLSRFGNVFVVLVSAFVIATVCAALSPCVLPTIGASGIIYAIIGMQSTIICGLKTKAIIPYFLIVFAWLFIGFFIHVNALLHLGCFFFGYVFWIIYKWNND